MSVFRIPKDAEDLGDIVYNEDDIIDTICDLYDG